MSGGISGKNAGRYSAGGKEGAWRGRGSLKMSWERGSSSRAEKSRSYGRCNPCISEIQPRKQILRILTTSKAAAITLVEGSLKLVKFDSGAILVRLNVVVGRYA